jgi:hypothetical protein
LEVGDTTDCPGCSTELRILNLSPLAVEEVSGGWDDEGEDDQHDSDSDESLEKEEW